MSEVSKIYKKLYKYCAYAQMKDEDTLIPFWIEHYIRLGFDHIYIIDDGSTNPITNSNYKNKVTVVRIDIPFDTFYSGNFKNSIFYDADIFASFQKSKQIYLLNVFKKIYGQNIEWLFICDADEFLYLGDVNDIYEYMNKYSIHDDIGCISFQWLCYGSSYHSYFPSGHIFENFILSSKKLHDHIKSLVHIDSTLSMCVHCCPLKNGRYQYIPTSNGILKNENLLQFIDRRITYNLANAYCSHFVILDFYTFTYRRLIRPNADGVTAKDQYTWIEQNNETINLSMIKYITDYTPKHNISVNRVIDIEKYNRNYGTELTNKFDMLLHFYKNKTYVITTELEYLLPIDFDVCEYRKLHTDISSYSDMEAKIHYIYHGKREKRIYNLLSLPADFNVEKYRLCNPDIAKMADIQLKMHYIEHGKSEKRIYKLNIPSDFDAHEYKVLNRDLSMMSDIELAVHYHMHGERENRIYKSLK